jgi:formate dehydrogenase iron-sulfur subunit
MAMTRRDFCKLVAAGTVSLAARPTAAIDSRPVIDCRQNYGVLVDTVACIGCRKCELACNRAHKLSNSPASDFDDRSVFKKHRRPTRDAFTVVNEFEMPDATDRKYTMKVQCMHCNDPACVSACIVGALHKDSQGPVVYDAWKCIGCRYCIVACPFQVPAYEYDNPMDPQVRKCDFCYDRLKSGEIPACVAICPNEALTFGTRGDLLEAAYTRIANFPDRYVNHVYGEHEVGGTSWLYLAPTDFLNTELPKLDAEPIPERTERIQHGIFKSFVPPLALYGLLGLIMHSMRNGNGKQENNHVNRKS